MSIIKMAIPQTLPKLETLMAGTDKTTSKNISSTTQNILKYLTYVEGVQTKSSVWEIDQNC